MTTKTRRILSTVLMLIPALLLVFSAFLKLSGAAQIVENLTKAGLGSYIKFIGVIELLSVILFLYPKTHKIGFLLICSYLGGALCIELANGQPPSAAVFLTIVWVAVFIKDKLMFLPSPKQTS